MTDAGAAADGLQQVVDALARRLGRSVAVDDTRGRLVVASRHFGDEDALRTHALLQRDSDPRVLAHFRAHDLYRWTTPGTIPADADLGIKARVACPVRAHGLPFGHLFLIADDDTDGDGVAAADVALAAVAADEIGRLLHRRLVLHEAEHARREELARSLVGPDAAARAAARRAVLDERLAEVVEPVLALAVRLPEPVTPDTAADADTALRRTAEGLVRDRHPGRALAATAAGSGTLLLLGRSATTATARAEAEQVGDDLRRELPGGRVVVGVGPPTTGPDAAAHSHDEARRAADAAVLLPALGDVVEPDDLGADAVLLALPDDRATAALYPAALRRLLEHEAADGLVETLEAYLDHAGDATATAAALRVHRSTLHYRLGRITTITGADLRDGRTRLALHVGLRLRGVLAARRARG